jgi:hypothetical protein
MPLHPVMQPDHAAFQGFHGEVPKGLASRGFLPLVLICPWYHPRLGTAANFGQEGRRARVCVALTGCRLSYASCRAGELRDQLVEGDRIAPYADPGRAVDRIGNGRADAAQPEFANTLGLHR